MFIDLSPLALYHNTWWTVQYHRSLLGSVRGLSRSPIRVRMCKYSHGVVYGGRVGGQDHSIIFLRSFDGGVSFSF